MRKQTINLIILGSLFMSFTLFTQDIFTVSNGTEDFIKGLGVAFNISALFVQKKLEGKDRQNHKV
jgi:hypothetical protein